MREIRLTVERTTADVSWSEVRNKPDSFPPESHLHDGRYYTEGETDALLTGKADRGDIPSRTSELTNDSGFLMEHQDISGKQDVIADLAAIRSGAQSGATAVQPAALNAYRTAAAQDAIDAGKVDKVAGMGLSTNDYTDADAAKLAGIETGADKTDAENVAAAGAVMEPAAEGTDGQVLTTDGAGGRSWETVESYTLPAATASALGGVKIGDGISVESDGTISAEGLPVLTGSSRPTNATVGQPGQLYYCSAENTWFLYSYKDNNGKHHWFEIYTGSDYAGNCIWIGHEAVGIANIAIGRNTYGRNNNNVLIGTSARAYGNGMNIQLGTGSNGTWDSSSLFRVFNWDVMELNSGCIFPGRLAGQDWTDAERLAILTALGCSVGADGVVTWAAQPVEGGD